MKRIYTAEVDFRQIKTLVPNIIIPSGNTGADYIKFVDLGNDWNSLIKTAVFISNDCTEKVLLDDNNCAKIPGSVLEKKGMFFFGLWGTQLTASGEIEFRYSTNLQTGIVGDGAYDKNAVTMQEPQAGIYERVLDYINKHIQNTQNPHSVTPEQIGTYGKETIDETIEKADIAYTELSRHLFHTSNPHNITAELVGAYTKDEVDELVREAGVTKALLENHKAAQNNPHNVTPEQIGTYDKDTIDMYHSTNRDYVDEKIGDIASALSEIKTLQQSYIDGGAE